MRIILPALLVICGLAAVIPATLHAADRAWPGPIVMVNAADGVQTDTEPTAPGPTNPNGPSI